MSQTMSGPKENNSNHRYRPAIAGSIANHMARHRAFHAGEIAQLRRLDPDRPTTSAFWRLMLRHHITAPHPEATDVRRLEGAWAQIIRGIAIGTRVGEDATEGPHRTDRGLGEALAHAGYSETNLNALLNAQDRTLSRLSENAVRLLDSKGQKFNWNQCAALLLNDYRSAGQQDNDRVRIARDYYRAVLHQQNEQQQEQTPK